MFNDIPKFNYKKSNNTSNFNENSILNNSIGKDWYKIIKSKNEIENKLKVRNENLHKNLSNIGINNMDSGIKHSINNDINHSINDNGMNNNGTNNNHFSVNRMVELENHKDGKSNNTLNEYNRVNENTDIKNEKFSLTKMNKLFDNSDNNSEISEISKENIEEFKINNNEEKIDINNIKNIKVDNILEYNQELINTYNKENYKKQMDNLINNIHIKSDLNISDMNIFSNNSIEKIQENTNNIQDDYNKKKMQLDEEFKKIGKNIDIKININKKENKPNLLEVIDEDLKREIENSNLKIEDIIN